MQVNTQTRIKPIIDQLVNEAAKAAVDGSCCVPYRALVYYAMMDDFNTSINTMYQAIKKHDHVIDAVMTDQGIRINFALTAICGACDTDFEFSKCVQQCHNGTIEIIMDEVGGI